MKANAVPSRALYGAPLFVCVISTVLSFVAGAWADANATSPATTTSTGESNEGSSSETSPGPSAEQAAAPSAEQAAAPSAETAAPSTLAGERARSQALAVRRQAQKAENSGETLAAERYRKAEAKWKQVQQALNKAAELEARAAELEKETTELEAQSRRAALLVEQTEARRARALARLEELGITPPPRGASVSEEPAKPGASEGTSDPKANPAATKVEK